MIDSRSYLAQVFDLAFGVKSPVFIPYTKDLASLSNNEEKYKLPNEQLAGEAIFSNLLLKPDDETDGTLSSLGTPIVNKTIFGGGNYKAYNQEGILVEFKLGDFMLPAASLLSFSRAKIIAKTPVLGSNGTVKELYGFEDWKIRIRGICLDDNARQTAKTAIQQKEELLKWERVVGSINVFGSLFSEKNITNISFESITFDQLEGKPNMIPFEIECDSDELSSVVFFK